MSDATLPPASRLPPTVPDFSGQASMLAAAQLHRAGTLAAAVRAGGLFVEEAARLLASDQVAESLARMLAELRVDAPEPNPAGPDAPPTGAEGAGGDRNARAPAAAPPEKAESAPGASETAGARPESPAPRSRLDIIA